MSDIKLWSNTAGNNNTAPPNGAPEGMPPSAVNDTMREMMAAVRRNYEAPEFRDWGHTSSYSNATTFIIPTDVSSIYHVNRRVRASVSAGTVYGTVQSVSYASPNTTITLILDSGSLDSGLSAVAVGPAVTGQATNAKGVAFTKPDGTASNVQDELAKVTGSLATITGNTTLTAADFGAIKNVTATATLTLPVASTVPSGQRITVKSTTTGNVLLAPNGSDTIDGASSSIRVPSFDTFELICNGSNGYIITRKGAHAVGDIIPAGATGTRTDAIVPDGSTVSRATYAGLFAVYGTTWGAGDGVSTFNLPDLRGRTLVGAGQGANLSSRSIGQSGGEEAHALTVDELAAHSHPISTQQWGGTLTNQSSNVHTLGSGTVSATDSTNNTGSGTAHNNMQPFAVAQFLIKT